MMGYTYGLDFEVVSFQTVNAADLGGKTIHHAFGFSQFLDLSIACNQMWPSGWRTGVGLSLMRSASRMLPSLERLSTGFVRTFQRQDDGSTTAMGG